MMTTGPMSTLHKDEYYEVTLEPSGVVRVTRSDTPALDLQRLENALAAVHEALAAHAGDGKAAGVLVDMRDAHPRNDSGFETVLRRHRASIHALFERRAVLVRSFVAKLQLSRLDREQAVKTGKTHVFNDEDEALEYLLGA